MKMGAVYVFMFSIIQTLVFEPRRSRLAGEASRQSGALFGGAFCEVFVVDGAFERPVASSEFGGDGVGDEVAEGVGDVVDVFVVGAVGAVAG